MDPLSVTMAVITVATFIKDLIELGEGIRSSIEKVGENRRQIRELSQDIVRTLYALSSLTHGKEDMFRGRELLDALENLKAEMLYVHSTCDKISPVQLPGLRGFKSRLKAWRERDDLERKITSLRERLNKCFLQFTASRIFIIGIAHSTLRIEQRLVVDGMENQVKAHRLEGMMAQVLLNTTFGRHKLGETIEVISSDPTFQSLESQFMSAQLKSLIDSIERLLANDNLTFEFEPSEDLVYPPGFIDSTILTPSHALIGLLQLVVKISGMPYVKVELQSAGNDWSKLMLQLSHIRMFSEAIAWGQLNIACFRYASKTLDYDTRALPHIARHLHHLSLAHRDRFETTLAVELSQQSLDLWIQSSELLPYDYRIDMLASMINHANNLLMSEHKADALSNAEDAASIARVIITELMECTSNEPSLAYEEVFEAAKSRDAFFLLARVLSFLDRHLESYATFMEGFQTAHRLPVPDWPPSGLDIDSFIDVICKLAEGGHLSLPMLTECMMLFRDLTRIYRNSFSYQFLQLLHAFAYFLQQPAPTLSNIRRFLEPGSDSSAPELDIAKPLLGDLDVVQDAVRLFYTNAAEHCTVPLMKNIFVTRFRTTIAVLRDLERSSALNMIDLAWVLFIAREILSLLTWTRADFSALLRVLGETIQKFSMNLVTLDCEWPILFSRPLRRICRHALKIGAHDEGLQLCKHVTEYLACPFHTGDGSATWSQPFLLLGGFIFCDAGRFSDAIQLVQLIEVARLSAGDGGAYLSEYIIDYYLVKARILGRLGRHSEALHFIRKGIATDLQVFKTDGSSFSLHRYILFTEQAAVSSCMGIPQTALLDAERAVAACQEVNIEGWDEEILCVQVHSFITLSDCLASIGKNDEALDVAQKAVSLYTPNANAMWKDYVFTIRWQELGGNTFFALSRRLATLGDKERALSNCEKAIELYRELVSLAPRHLPTLASSLQHIASILSGLGRQLEAMAASREAVQILRKVADSETYFLPTVADAWDQLATFLVETGDEDGARAATDEAVEARMKSASLPPGPEWLFEKVADSGDEEELDWWELMEYRDALENPAREGDKADVEGDEDYEEYHDAVDTSKIVKVTDPETTLIEDGEQPFSSPATTVLDMDLTPVVTDSMPAGLVVSVKEPPYDFSKVGLIGTNDLITALMKRQQDPSRTAAVWKAPTTLKDVLNKSLELRLSVSMQSRPMDLIWWILLAILSAIVYTRTA
ncbi:Tetratricopeptide repeat family [Favolaschia claudopus]|uniref:Tetratricopeptide repeat family n=1 Tax=Favolaschia claudopus TaxID=2862362 RepID=A0AAV9Z6X9_9AGAR